MFTITVFDFTFIYCHHCAEAVSKSVIFLSLSFNLFYFLFLFVSRQSWTLWFTRSDKDSWKSLRTPWVFPPVAPGVTVRLFCDGTPTCALFDASSITYRHKQAACVCQRSDGAALQNKTSDKTRRRVFTAHLLLTSSSPILTPHLSAPPDNCHHDYCSTVTLFLSFLKS